MAGGFFHSSNREAPQWVGKVLNRPAFGILITMMTGIADVHGHLFYVWHCTRVLMHSLFQSTPNEGASVIIPTVLINKRKLREVKQPVPGHTAVIISGGCNYNSGLPFSRVLITDT